MTAHMTKHYNFIRLFFFLSIVLFFAGVAAKLSAPLVEGDWSSVLQAGLWAKGGKLFTTDYPPLYSFLLSVFSGHNGSIVIFRCLNLLAVCLTAFLLYGVSRRHTGPELSLVAVSLYLLTPAVIQGISLLDFADASWLPLFFLLLLRLAAALNRRFSAAGFLATAAAAMVCIGFKMTSAIALFLSVFLYWLAGDRSVKKTSLPVLAALAAGALVFALGWKAAVPYLFSADLRPDSYAYVKINLIDRLAYLVSWDYVAKLPVILAYLLCWFSPFLLVMWIGPIFKRGGLSEADTPPDIRFFAFVGAVYSIGYFFVGGVNHGFPRYHMAIWPVIVFLAVFECREVIRAFFEKDVFKAAVIALPAVLFGVMFLPDPLRLLNLGVKEALIAGHGLASVAAGLAAVLAFYPLLAWFLTRHGAGLFKTSAVFAAFMTAAAVFFLVTDLSQMKARYLTSYEYGTEGKRELAAELGPAIPAEAALFATHGLAYYIRPWVIPGFTPGDWLSADSIRAAITRARPEAVVLGAGNNTLWQFKLFLYDPVFSAFMKERYTLKKTGTFLVWRKKQVLEKK